MEQVDEQVATRPGGRAEMMPGVRAPDPGICYEYGSDYTNY